MNALERVEVDRAVGGEHIFGLAGDQAIQATDDLFSYDSTRAVLVERDRQPLMSAPPGDGYRVITEILIETTARARVMTARFDVRRPPGGDANSWRIVDVERLTLVQGLYRLRLDTENQFDAQDFSIEAQDVRFTLHSGSVFHVLSGDGITISPFADSAESRLSALKKPNCAIIALAESSRQLRDSHTSVSGAIIRAARMCFANLDKPAHPP